MVRQQIGVFSQAVRCAFDLHDDRVVQQPVEQRRGHHAVAEHITPFTEAAVGRQDDRAALVADVDELEDRLPPLEPMGR